MIVEFPVLKHEEGRAAHILRPNIVEGQTFYENVKGWNLDYFIYFYQRTIYDSYLFFVSIEDLHSFVGHVRLVEFDGARTDELVGIEDRKDELWLLVVSF